jgi:hypothetical protein
MKHMPSCGVDFWNAMHRPAPQALATLRNWQNGAMLKPDARRELTAFLASREMREQQIAAAEPMAELADHDAQAW